MIMKLVLGNSVSMLLVALSVDPAHSFLHFLIYTHLSGFTSLLLPYRVFFRTGFEKRLTGDIVLILFRQNNVF